MVILNKDFEIAIPLKYSRYFLENSVDCETNLILTWPENCVFTNSEVVGTFRITDTKLYIPVVTLSTQDNTKLLKQIKSGFKRTIKININENHQQLKISVKIMYLTQILKK